MPPAAAPPTGRPHKSLAQKIALNSSTQAFGQLFAAAAGTASVAIVTRYLTLDQYGGLIAAFAFVSLFSVAADLGISSMTVRAIAREPEREHELLSSALWVWILFGGVTAVVILAVSHVVYAGGEHAVTRHAVLVLLCSFPLGPIAGAATTKAILEQRVWLSSLLGIVGRAFSLGAIGVSVALDLGPLAIAGAFASATVVSAVLMGAVFRPRVSLGLGLDRARIVELLAAALPLGMIMVINGMYFRLDAFLLSLLGSNRDVAVYGVAYKAFETLVVLPGFVMVTLIPELARLRPDEERFNAIVQKAFTGMCLISVPLLAVAVLGRPAIVVLGGSRYAEGGIVVALVIVAVVCSCVQGVFGNALVTQGRQGVLLRQTTAVLVINGLLNVAFIPLWGVHGSAIALVASEVLSLALTMMIYRGIAPLPRLPTPWRLAAATAAMLAATTVRFAIPGVIPGMLVALAVAIPVYGVVLWALRAVPSYVAEPARAVLRSLRPGRAM